VLHEPCGQEHPYEQLAIERFPRAPLPGQEVSIGLATSPSGAAESVWATWSVDAAVGTGRASGTRLEDDGQLSYWRVGLPGFLAGQSVEYRVHASGDCGTVSTDPFTFFVPEWREVGEVLCYRPTGDGLVLECVARDPALRSSLRLSFPRADQLRVQLAYGVPAEASPGRAGVGERKPPPGAACTLVEDSPAGITVATERLRLAIDRRHGRLDLSRAGGGVLLRQAEPATWLLGQDGRPSQLRLVFESPPSEAFYGFGERFNALNQRGNVLDVRVYDPYKDLRTRTYLPVPFFLSSQGYGLYVDSSRDVVFDLASTQPDRLSFSAELAGEGMLDFHVMEAADPSQIIAAYTDLTGKPHLPPIWAFGPWMSSNEWNSQARVMEQVAKTFEHGIPTTVLVIEAWSDESTFYIWNDAQYSPKPPEARFSYGDFTFPPDGRWPDPKTMVDELHRRGLRVLLWQIPVNKHLGSPHAQHDADEAHMVKKGYCVQEADGQPYRIRSPLWFSGGLVLDFTNPEAVQWWLNKRACLLDDIGVDGFKTDGGEHLWGQALRFADGRRGDEVCNIYPNLYVGAYHRFASEKRKGDTVTFSRAGFAGAQAYPCHWAGDEDSTWQAFRASILAGLNAGISGIPFWGWDLAGFGGEIPSAELYLRAVAMAAFCPIMQYHSEYNEHREPCRDRTPWNIQERTGDADVIPVFRKYANVRMNLLPYIYSEAWKSSQSGVPLMRALPVEFPADLACRDYPYQYFFGDHLLVAPVVEENRTNWPVYLPEGTWHSLWTGETQKGPKVLDYPAPKELIPVFVRAGAVLPLNLGERYALGDGVGNAVGCYRNLCFMLYPEEQTSYEWFDGVSSKTCTLRCEKGPRGAQARIEIEPIGHAHCLMMRAAFPADVRVDGQPLKRAHDFAMFRDSIQGGWYRDAERGLALVRLRPHRSPVAVEVA
jgi:alpha-glucosidase (family GH31 glycosyl hydrolase)